MPLFQPLTVNGVTLPNRVVKSAMAEGLCDALGHPSPGLAKLYGRWSAGGVGLAITGMATVRQGYSFTGGEIGLHSDEFVPALREVTEAVHRHPGKIFAQLNHAPPQLPRPVAQKVGSTAPSAGFNKTNLLWNRALTDEEIRGIARDFGPAARRAREAGFDGVQLHAAHGYLMSRFLSPLHNRRDDRWGGDFERRLAFLAEVFHAVRSAVGKDFPVTAKLNAHDGERGGLTIEDGLRIGQRLQDWGIDAIEVSAGTGDVGLGFYPNKGGMPVEEGKKWLGATFGFLKPVMPVMGPFIKVASRAVALDEEAYFWPLARRFAEELTVPVFCVGGVRTLKMAKRILTESRVAAVSLARPLVRQPTLVRAWQKGETPEATCESCNRCFVQVGLGERLRCHLRPGEEA
jgi:2,4-dienoyl-CoA reductase-like NADH-dependent reductase (Old Yellow Enzyme family)